MGARSILQWVLMASLLVLFAVSGWMTWNYRATTVAADRANRLCASIRAGMSADEVVAHVKAAEGARLTASADEVSGDFGRCLCFVPIAQGRAADGIQMGCKF